MVKQTLDLVYENPLKFAITQGSFDGLVVSAYFEKNPNGRSRTEMGLFYFCFILK